jgi:hypothetical protein
MATKRTGRKCRQIADTSQSERKDDSQPIEHPPVKSKHFRKTAKEEIERKYKGIVEALGNGAVGGSVPHTKLLFDLGGVKEEVAAAPSKRRKATPSLGKRLLEEAEALKRNKHKPAEDKLR